MQKGGCNTPSGDNQASASRASLQLVLVSVQGWLVAAV